jgi:hypothetical protein
MTIVRCTATSVIGAAFSGVFLFFQFLTRRDHSIPLADQSRSSACVLGVFQRLHRFQRYFNFLSIIIFYCSIHQRVILLAPVIFVAVMKKYCSSGAIFSLFGEVDFFSKIHVGYFSLLPYPPVVRQI